MLAHEFVACIRREVLEQNIAAYRQDLEGQLLTSSRKDSRWPQMADFYKSLSEEQRRQLMFTIRQIMVDTLSNILGILDGSTLLEEHRDYFHLTYGDDRRELNGSLQDQFLSSES